MAGLPKKIPHAALKDPIALQQWFPGTSAWRMGNLDTLGYSGATFTRLTYQLDGQTHQLILKELDVENDWFSRRSDDTLGREATILVTPALHEIHKIFALPYLYVGIEPCQVGMLMQDVSPGLFPDERKSISDQDQELILEKLAEMHAFFWEDSSLASFPWLHQYEDFLYLMGPLDHENAENDGLSARNVQDAIKSGWKQAQEHLPEPVRKLLFQHPQKLAECWKDLPKTLVHGDTKIANFAKMPSRQLCLLDWAFAGHAPCTVDIGWFLAVNATRLCGSKEIVFRKYRDKLETHLKQALDDQLWNRLEAAGVLCGALMLLWSKAKALGGAQDNARLEWDWWMRRLSEIAAPN